MENVKVKDRFIDEKTGIEYIKQGDYYLPNLVLAPEETNYTIGKYGRMKLNYLKNHKKAEYIILFMDGKLNRYLHEIDIACEDRIKTIISHLVKQENVTEELNQMEWVCRTNSIKNRAEEIAFKERIYRYRKNETMPFANYNKKYYKKTFTGPKVDYKKYNYNIFYRWYIHALYWLGVLPAKVTVEEITVQDYKVRNKTKRVFEELSFINQSHSKSIEDIKTHKKEIEEKLPILKGERENLWFKHKKASSANEKAFILERINLISDEISTLYGQRNACTRIIDTYNRVYEEVEKEQAEKKKLIELTECRNKKIINKI